MELRIDDASGSYCQGGICDINWIAQVQLANPEQRFAKCTANVLQVGRVRLNAYYNAWPFPRRPERSQAPSWQRAKVCAVVASSLDRINKQSHAVMASDLTKLEQLFVKMLRSVEGRVGVPNRGVVGAGDPN